VSYLDRARELRPRLAAAADQIDRERRIPEPLVDALHDAGFFRLLLPRSFDGGELDPVTFTLVIEEIAKGDASTAWVLCQTAGCSMTAAYVPPDVARDIFGDRRAVMAWGPGPGSRAVVADGGYRVTGTWSFASGVRHATWFGGYCPIYEADGAPRRRPDGSHESRTMLFPARRAQMTDVWHVIGLRGTASDSYSVSDLFVPKAYSMARDDASERRQPGALYCFPIVNLFASGFAGVALAIARACLDDFVALARDKTPRGMSRTLRESAAVQGQVGQCEARLRSSRMLLLQSLETIWRDVGSQGVLSLDQRVTIRLAATNAIQNSKEVVDVVYHAAGGTSVFQSQPFERRFRDMHTVTQQLQGRLSHFETVGQHLMGLEPDTNWL
jgi:alkylation response protein AidB-like acyl-CoA dehydrogenase